MEHADFSNPDDLKRLVSLALESAKKGEDPRFHLPKLSQSFLDAFYGFAYRFYREGKYMEATDFFRFLTLITPYEKRGWMGLAAAEQMRKNYRHALSAYAFTCVLDDEDPYPHFHAAECYFHLGEVVEGIRALNVATENCGALPQFGELRAKIEVMKEGWGCRR